MKVWCEECEWSASTENGESSKDVSEAALDHFEKSGHLPIQTTRGSDQGRRNTLFQSPF